MFNIGYDKGLYKNLKINLKKYKEKNKYELF